MLPHYHPATAAQPITILVQLLYEMITLSRPLPLHHSRVLVFWLPLKKERCYCEYEVVVNTGQRGSATRRRRKSTTKTKSSSRGGDEVIGQYGTLLTAND